jgi:hypothetical protein
MNLLRKEHSGFPQLTFRDHVTVAMDMSSFDTMTRQFKIQITPCWGPESHFGIVGGQWNHRAVNASLRARVVRTVPQNG